MKSSAWPPEIKPFEEYTEPECDNLLRLTQSSSGLLLPNEKRLLLATRYVCGLGFGTVLVEFHQGEYAKIEHLVKGRFRTDPRPEPRPENPPATYRK